MTNAPSSQSKKDDPEKMAAMQRWLEQVCSELGLDTALARDNSDQLLGLTGRIAHGPSRPGAPLSCFLLGLAVGADTGSDSRELDPEQVADAVRERAERLIGLIEN
ncbi:hypothetical protein CCICO_01620 [Corynebacterium ciconiae DSM 44920]|uniref:DUF6457 domain-containing protein n=1 Tax=Corynebacterium ciconiae TaxID=227319 RepID=UPI000361CBAF|nr:DUF6457 domain-containing protein [Corynebacterium ciconiae]WKD60378.1 hypothetical protein CCICO_01620 [Corynebacterium ciconiae DSM 44920]